MMGYYSFVTHHFDGINRIIVCVWTWWSIDCPDFAIIMITSS